MTFLDHFQLHIRYEIGTKLLLTFWQDKATHILDHIQEWRRWKRLIKAFIPSEFILEWFLKSLLPYIAKDVSTSGIQNEDMQSLGHKIWIWSMLILNCCMRLYLMLHILVSIPISSLDHMPMALWVVQVPNLWIQLWNTWANCLLINLFRDKLGFCWGSDLQGPKFW